MNVAWDIQINYPNYNSDQDELEEEAKREEMDQAIHDLQQ